MKNFGIVLFCLGIFGAVFSLNMDTSILTEYGRVNNIGLMNDRSNYLIFSSVMILVGVALFISSLKSTITESSNSYSASSLNTRKCPFCAEFVNAEARICKHCKSELPELENVVIKSTDESIFVPTDEDYERVKRIKESISQGYQISTSDDRFLDRMGIKL